MSNNHISKDDKEKMGVCNFFRNEIVKDFKELSKNKETVTQSDLEYELARDRKMGLALKSIMVEIAVEKMGHKRKTIEIN